MLRMLNTLERLRQDTDCFYSVNRGFKPQSNHGAAVKYWEPKATFLHACSSQLEDQASPELASKRLTCHSGMLLQVVVISSSVEITLIDGVRARFTAIKNDNKVVQEGFVTLHCDWWHAVNQKADVRLENYNFLWTKYLKWPPCNRLF